MKTNYVPAGISALITTICLTASLNALAAPGDGIALKPLSNDEVADLVFMREEEKLARDSYLLLSEKWGLMIFANIANAEQRHMAAIENLIVKYGLTDPVGDESLRGNFVDQELAVLFEDLMTLGNESMMDGLVVGAMIEETDIEDIQIAINRTGHADILGAYENLLCGSRNHLRAFIGQIELNGGAYTPIVLTAEEFSDIVNTPTERACGAKAGPNKKGPAKLRANGRN